jgi:hypothetical protein
LGNISFNNTLSGDKTLTVNTAGTTLFDKAVSIAQLTTDAPGTVQINASTVATSGTQTFNDPMTLLSNTVLSSTGAAAMGNISFNNTLSGDKTLTVNTAGTTLFDKAVSIGQLTTDAPGFVQINAPTVTTTGTQTYSDPMTLLSNTVLSSSGAAALGNISFNSTIGGAKTLAVNTAGTTLFNDTVNIAQLATDAPGFLQINAATVTTSDAQTYNDPITLLSNTVLSSNGAATLGNISFNNTLTGDKTLTVNTAGTTLFDKAVSIGQLTTDLAGFVQINAPTVATTGTQTYNDPMTLLSNTVLSSSGAAALGNISFNNTLSGDKTLTVNTAGTTLFDKAVSIGQLTSDAPGAVQINAPTVATTGTQTYNDDVLVQSDSVISGSTLTLNKTLFGDTATRRLVLNGQVSVTLNSTVRMGHLETGSSGTTYLNNTPVLTTSNASMLFGNDVVVSAPIISIDATDSGALATGANITFNKSLSSAVEGGTSVVLNAGTAGSVRFLGAVGKDANAVVKPLNALTVTAGGGIVISGGYVHTVGTQTYNNPMTLAASTTLLAGQLNLSTVTATAPQVGLKLVSQDAQVLKDITMTGDLDVTTGGGGLTGGVSQAAGTAMKIGGASTFTADTTKGQVATLNISANNFVGAVFLKEKNGGSWKAAEIVSATAMSMGETTVTGDLTLKTMSADITQVGPIKVGGRTNIVAAGSVNLVDDGNNFAGYVDVDTGGALELTTSGALTMSKAVTVGKTVLKSTGKIDLGTSVFGDTLKVNSGGFEIMQSGPVSFGGNTDFDAGTEKIDLFNPKNLWKGSIVYKGGIVMINHPQLLNATNAGTLIVRVEATAPSSTVVKVPTPAPAQSSSSAPKPAEAGKGADISISQQRAATPQQSGLVTVAVSAEVASSGKGFAFSLEERMPASVPKGTQVQVSQLDGKPLPEWLRYEPETQKVIATAPPSGAFPIQIKASVGGVETVIVITELPK